MSSKNEDHGTIELNILNQVNGRHGTLRANPGWTMEKVRDHAYTTTKDKPRPDDRFTCKDESKTISGDLLTKTLEEFLRSGPCPGEHEFHICPGVVGGA